MSLLNRLNSFVADRTGYAVRRVEPQPGRTSTKKRPAARPPAKTKQPAFKTPPTRPVPKSSPARHSSGPEPRERRSGARTAPLPPARFEPGTAAATDFFDDYPRFYGTSKTTPDRVRLNLRFEAIFTQNREIFDGARVLDIASHDGRWSFAALQSGAAEVIGVEARPELVENAYETFGHYDVPRDRFRFVLGDVYEVLAEQQFDVDVVMCLGFLYHTARYNELMRYIVDCSPRHLIVDSRIVVADRPIVHLTTERVEQERNAVADRFSVGDRVLSGRPSSKAIETMVDAYGFDVVRYSDWASLLRDNEVDRSVDVYANGQRVTMLCAART